MHKYPLNSDELSVLSRHYYESAKIALTLHQSKEAIQLLDKGKFYHEEFERAADNEQDGISELVGKTNVIHLEFKK